MIHSMKLKSHFQSLLGSILLSMLFLVSCEENKERTLLRLESRIYQTPDSVHTVLQAMNTTGLSSEQMIRFQLLNIIYNDIDNNLPHSDSIINTIIDYYESNIDKGRLFLAYSLKGKILLKSHLYLPASDCFQQAEAYLSYCREDYAKLLLYSQMVHLYHFKEMKEEELQAVQKELYYASRLNNNLHKIRAWYDYSNYYRSVNNPTRAISVLKQALALSHGYDSYKMRIYNDLADLYIDEKRPDVALYFLNLASVVKGTHPKTESLKARAFTIKKQSDSAEYYYSRSIDQLKLRYKVSALYDLYKIKKDQSLNKEAFEFLELHVTHRDSLDISLKEKRLENLMDIKEYQKQRKLVVKNQMDLIPI